MTDLLEATIILATPDPASLKRPNITNPNNFRFSTGPTTSTITSRLYLLSLTFLLESAGSSGGWIATGTTKPRSKGPQSFPTPLNFAQTSLFSAPRRKSPQFDETTRTNIEKTHLQILRRIGIGKEAARLEWHDGIPLQEQEECGQSPGHERCSEWCRRITVLSTELKWTNKREADDAGKQC